MILYFTGTGNSSYVANKIGKMIQDEAMNLLDKIREHDYSELYSDKPWVIVSPTYAWRIPQILYDWLKHTKLSGNRKIYFVMTCDSSIGNASAYNKKLCVIMGLNYMGSSLIAMPENYIALYHSPSKNEARQIIQASQAAIFETAKTIQNEHPINASTITIKDRINSSLINNIFYPTMVHTSKFYSTNACIACGECVRLCPLKSIHIENDKPIWGKQCTHCLACINHCSKEAIEYGKHTKGLERYICPDV